MDQVLAFLKDCGTFYIATIEDNQPRVRPFGFVMKYQNKLYFCSGTMKPFCRQIEANRQIEICTCNANSEWLRVSGKAVLVDDLSAKKQAFSDAPGIASLYKDPASPNFALFYIENATAHFCSFMAPTRIVNF